jgi:hypothetical protein
MKNLAELLRTVEVIANYRYGGSVILSREDGEWRVEFLEKDRHSKGFTRVEAGRGRTLEEALDRAQQFEIEKASDDFDSMKAFMKQVGKK